MLGRYPTHGDPLLTFRHPFQASSAARITATLRFEPHLILGVVHLPLLASPWPRLVENRTSPSEWCVCERSDVGVTYLRLHFRRSPHGEHQGLLRLSDSPTCSVRLDNENGYDDQNHFFASCRPTAIRPLSGSVTSLTADSLHMLFYCHVASV
jgi:hypothetical protein